MKSSKLSESVVHHNTKLEIIARYLIGFSGLLLLLSSFFIAKSWYFAAKYSKWEIGQISTKAYQLHGNLTGIGTAVLALIFISILVWPFLKEIETKNIKTLIIVNYVTTFLLITPLIGGLVYALTIFPFIEAIVGMILLIVGTIILVTFYQILLNEIKKQWKIRKKLEYEIDKEIFEQVK